MGERRHPRAKMVFPIRVFGLGEGGKAFSQLAHTLDFSQGGIRLGGLRLDLKVGDELTVEYKRSRCRYTVRWLGTEGTPSAGQAGVQSLEPEKNIFVQLPMQGYVDDIDAGRLRDYSKRESVATQPAGKPAPAEAAPAEARPAGWREQLSEDLRKTANDPDSALQVVATTACELLKASGAAVAVLTREDWVCRASAGIAPRVGVRFQNPEGLTGEAVRTGEIVYCNDAENDVRINRSVWRSVRLRSGASVPIRRQSYCVGVLEVFSEAPRPFSDGDRLLLSELADALAKVIAGSSTNGDK